MQKLFLPLLILAMLGCRSETQPSSDSDHGILSESERLGAWFDEVWDEALAKDPIWQSYLGIKEDYAVWGDYSPGFEEMEHEDLKRYMIDLKAKFDFEKLNAEAKMSYRLWMRGAEERLANHRWRYHDYPLNQMFGTHTHIPSFLINIHQVADRSDAEAYVSRVEAIDTLIDAVLIGLRKREELGVIPPAFVFPKVLQDCKNLMQGAPLTNGEGEHELMADFREKLEKIEVVDQALTERMEAALLNGFKPGFEKLIGYWESLAPKGDERAGSWKLPDGDAYYKHRLAMMTTTNITAEDVFDLGQGEVERIHKEMGKIMLQVGKGDMGIQEFFRFMETDKQFYESNDEAGRNAYLSRTQRVLDDMDARLDELFITKPKAEFVLKRVEPFREKTAGKAFYQQPAPDGSRPGAYYVNLYDMTQMPTYQMEALAYHEAIPGHHMQNAIKQEVETLPKFRRMGGGYTAYGEGWGLYSEFIPKEMGFYKNPYSDFGRLAMELWRACRLVVDAGIHTKKWTREQGIEFYVNNTPNPREDCVKMVERHIVMPAQATAYKIGQLKILELREKAKMELGKRFDIREFHEVVLVNGSVPLDILEENIDAWVQSKKRT